MIRRMGGLVNNRAGLLTVLKSLKYVPLTVV